MPRGKQIEIKAKRGPAIKAKPEIDEREINRIKLMLAQEEEAIEDDLRGEMSRMIDAQDLKMSRELGSMESKNKRLIMWIGVSLAMLLIVVFWVSSLDFSINTSYSQSSKQIDPKSLAEYKDNLDKTFKEVMTQIDQLKEQSKQTTTEPAASSTTSSEPVLK